MHHPTPHTNRLTIIRDSHNFVTAVHTSMRDIGMEQTRAGLVPPLTCYVWERGPDHGTRYFPCIGWTLLDTYVLP